MLRTLLLGLVSMVHRTHLPTGGAAADNTATMHSEASPRMVTINLIINGILSDTFTGEMDAAGNVDVQLGNLMATA